MIELCAWIYGIGFAMSAVVYGYVEPRSDDSKGIDGLFRLIVVLMAWPVVMLVALGEALAGHPFK